MHSYLHETVEMRDKFKRTQFKYEIVGIQANNLVVYIKEVMILKKFENFCLNAIFLLPFNLKTVKVGESMKGSLEIKPVSRDET